MVIELDRQLEPIIPFAETFAPEEINLDEQFAGVKSEIKLAGEVRRKDFSVEVSGTINSRIELSCSRCLSPVEVKVDAPFEINLVTLEEYEKYTSEEIHGAELELSVFDGAIIDTKEIVREQMLLMLPSHPICREDCLGLCPKCGKDLNDGKCACEPETDSRWEALKQLKIKGQDAD